MTGSDPRIEAAAKALCLPHAGGEPARPCPVCVTEAEGALAAADAVDPLRHTDDGWELAWVRATPGERRTDIFNPSNRAGVAPAGTPTKRIWPEP